jgi:hypothetical protein
LAVVNRATINVDVQVTYIHLDIWSTVVQHSILFIHYYSFYSSENSIFTFVKHFHTDFHSGFTSLHSYQQWIRVPTPPHPSQNFLSWLSLMRANLIEVRWNLSVVLICIFFKLKNAEYTTCICWSFVLLLRNVCSTYLPIY